MFFAASKLLWYLVQPLVVILLIGGAGILATLLRMPKLGLGLVGTSFVILAIVSLSPLGLLMLSVLENRFQKPPLPAEVTGIVVLGGSFDTRIGRTRGELELNDAADRITTTMALARQFPDARVVFSGGAAAMLTEDITESSMAQKLFAALGLAPERLELEDRSRNTTENAIFTREIAQPQPGETWLLVTSAAHMPRAVGCFRVAGFDVLPYPTDYQTPSGDALFWPSTATVRNLEKVHFAIREYLGLAVYRLTGKTDALFPAPSA
ncbi:YdcF family protein [Aureimonas flava]|uniref:YdcF family protein n=1 Tax=Aureimonas flava TaxID=2320271 RepID=A0A3A1WNH6_9HYPH|nr:YdcF family protein [Aureimonas flava]RIY01547.1 YdcF family protein [Aureimonas flava]